MSNESGLNLTKLESTCNAGGDMVSAVLSLVFGGLDVRDIEVFLDVGV